MTRASWHRIHLFMVALATLAILAPEALAQSPSSASSGVTEGRVTDATTGEALPGARLAMPRLAPATRLRFSALDKVGHDFGPNSHEIQDVLIRPDRTLGGLFAGSTGSSVRATTRSR